MALPGNAQTVVVRGFWWDEATSSGVQAAGGRPATVTFAPVPLEDAPVGAPNLRDLTASGFIKTRTRIAAVDKTTGYFATVLVASDDPDLDAYAGREVTFLGEEPFTIEVPHDAPTVTVDAALAAATGLTPNSSVKAIWLTDCARVDTPPPPAPINYLSSSQTLSNIAAGIDAHEADPTSHPDIRAAVVAGDTALDGRLDVVEATLPNKQPLDSDLTAIGGLTPANDDVVQRKAGGWTNRTPSQLKADMALDQVTNTSDSAKPVSTAQQAALDLKSTAFTQTATKIANYTAAANEIVPLDTSGGTFTLTGPTSGKAFGFRWKAGTTAPTIAAPAGYTISGNATITPGLAPSSSAGEVVLWQAFGTDYQSVGGFKPQSALNAANDLRYTHALNWIIDTDYGTVGNGTTDDTAALQAAVNAAVAGRRTLWLTRASYRVTSTITVPDRGLNLRGPGRARATSIISEVAGPVLQLGADNQVTHADGAMTSGSTTLTGSGFTGLAGKYITVLGAGASGAPLYTTIASVTSDTAAVLTLAASTTVSSATYMLNTWEGNTYDGTQSLFVSDVYFTTKTASRATALANGTGSYLTGSIGIADWRGGDIHLDRVSFEGFDTAFFGVQSDINHWSRVEFNSNHLGAYLGPRSDQLTCIGLSTLLNDRALDLDRVATHRYYGCQFVGDGTNTINPIRIRSAWSQGSSGVSFDDCWFEHFQGYAAAAVEAFIEIATTELVTSTDVHIRNPTIAVNASGQLPRAQYLVKCGRGDNISIENPNNQNWKNLDRLVEFVGTTSPSVFLIARNQSTTVFGTINNGTGSPSVTTLQWGALGTAGGFTVGGGGITAGAGSFTGRVTAGVVSQTLAANGAVTLNSQNGNVQQVTLQANATSSSITNAPSANSTNPMTITWIQDSTGGRTYAWPSNCKFAGGAAPTDTTASKRTSVTFTYDGANWNEIGRAVAVG